MTSRDFEYQILLLEDNQSDADLILLKLEELEFPVAVDHVTGKDSFKRAITGQTPDLVISDYELGGFTGLQAYEIVKNCPEYIPFVLVSGYIGEEKAFEAIKAGIDDYVMKDNLVRLVPTVARLLKQREQKIQQMLNDKIFHATFENEELGVAIIDGDLNYVMANEEFCKLSGYQEHELTGLSALDLNIDEHHYDVASKLRHVIKGDGGISGNWLLKNKEGYLIDVHSTVSLIDLPYQTNYLISFVRDTSSEEQLSRLRRQTEEISGVGGWEYDVTTGKIYHTPMAHKIYVVEGSDETNDGDNFISIFNKESQEKIRYSFEQAAEHQKPFKIQGTMGGNESGKIIEITGKPLISRGKTVKISGTVEDISEKIEQEKELKKLSRVARETQNGVIITGPNGLVEWVNEAFTKITGYSLEESKGKKPGDFLQGPDTDPDAVARISDALDRQEPVTEELLNYSKEGNPYWIRLNITPIFDEENNLSQFFAIQEDITSRKFAELELRETEQKLRNIIEHSTNLFYKHDTDHKFTYLSPHSKEFLGLPPDAVNKIWSDFLTHNSVNELGKERTQKAIETGEPQPSYELELKKCNEDTLWVQVNESPILDNGEVVAIAGSLTDITALKRKESELQRSLERLNEAQQVAKMGSWEFDMSSGSVEWSDNMYQIYDRDKDKGVPTYEEVLAYYPDQAELHDKKVSEAIEQGIPYSFDIKMKTELDAIKYLHVEGLPIKDGDGKVESLHGIVLDITERKIAEYELESSEQKLQDILNNVEGMFQKYRLDPSGEDELLYVTGAVEKLHEVKPEELQNSTVQLWEQVVKEDREELQKSIRESAETLSKWDHKYRIITPSGKHKWIHGKGNPKQVKDGSVIWDSLKIDVTKQEEAIAEREEIYRLLEQNVSEIYIFDQESLHFQYVNEAASNNLGYDKNQLLTMTPLDLKTEFTQDYLTRLINPVMQGVEQVVNFTATHTRADGSRYPVQVYLRAGSYKEKDVFIAHIIDETEKKIANERLRALIETAPIPIYIESKDGKVIDLWNEAAEKVLGFSKQEALDSLMPHVGGGPQMDSYHHLLEKIKEGQSIYGAEVKRIKKDGTVFPARINASPLFNSKGQIDSILVMLEDISEQREMEDKLKYQVSLSDAILDSLPGLFYMMDEDLNMIRVNQNVYNFFSIDKGEIESLDPISMIAPEERDLVKAKIEETLTKGTAEVETKMIVGEQRYDFYINGTLMEHNRDKFLIGNGINITETKKAQQRNKVLLQEIHHRVKNNLAIVSGLLEMELFELDNEQLRLPLVRSRNRINSIAKVHELLYGSKDYSNIEMGEYIKQLVVQIENTLSGDRNIGFEIDFEHIAMNINDAIPLGLLLNELVTNSLKYAFRNKDTGLISIKGDKPNGKYRIYYHDDGQGIIDTPDFDNTRTLGMQIIGTLLRQLGATYKLDTNKQFHMVIEFTPKKRGSHSNLQSN
jgi:PAS domain S-box-containing protein